MNNNDWEIIGLLLLWIAMFIAAFLGVLYGYITID